MTLKELSEKHGFVPTGILHVGAGMLEEAEQYRDMGVKTVIWVEALPHDDKRSARAKEFGNTLYEQCPLSDRMENVILLVASNSCSSSIMPFLRHSEIYPEVVVTNQYILCSFRGDQFLAYRFPPEIDTLVVDVQGAELRVVRGLGELMERIKRAWIEVNLKEQYEGAVLKPELDDWMAKSGFVNNEFYPAHPDEFGDSFYWR